MKTIEIDNGFITLANTDFKCPKCQLIYSEKDYYKSLCNSKRGYIYKSCKGCKVKLGISANYKGDVVVWIKDEEILGKKIIN